MSTGQSISERMREVMQAAARENGRLRGKPNTHAALRRRGFLFRTNDGTPFLSVAGYHALGLNHPHEVQQ